MSLLLDTCVLSELHKKRPEPRVVEWLERQDESALYVSVITFGELEKGIALLSDSKRRSTIRRWVEIDLTARFRGRTLPVDLDVANTWGRIAAAGQQAGRPLPVIDGFLAATAIVHGFAFVTRNTVDVEATGVRLQNPWSAKGVRT